MHGRVREATGAREALRRPTSLSEIPGVQPGSAGGGTGDLGQLTAPREPQFPPL